MKALIVGLVLVVTPSLLQVSVAVAQTAKQAASGSDGITRDQADAILNELKAIHQLLEKQAGAASAPQPQQKVKVSMKVEPGWQVMGREDAPVTIVEFSDYQCPFCRRFHTQTFADLKKNYIDTGKVRYISRDFPLEFHGGAKGAALAARCAAEQNKFWEMRDLLLGTSADLSSDSIAKFAAQINLDAAKFQACFNANKYLVQVQKDLADGKAVGVGATPSFVVGKTAKDQIDGVRIAGAVTYSYFETVIQEQMHPAQQAAAGN